ncbi:MAG: glutamate mutase L [Anaerolineae bacterium]|nr:hypothetical protein [Chloroflexota bacterium]
MVQPETQSILLADIGHSRTHLGLVERVEGVYRLAARTETPSVGDPLPDLAASLKAGLEQLQSLAGRPLLSPDGAPLTPRTRFRGIDRLALTSSGAPPVRCGIIGLTEDLSLQQARQVCSNYGTDVMAEVALAWDRPIRHAALASLCALEPQLIVLAGGVDGGPERPMVEAATVLAALYRSVTPERRPELVMAGNQRAGGGVHKALQGVLACHCVANILPALGTAAMEGLVQALSQQAEGQLALLPGYREVSSWAGSAILTSDAGTGIIQRFVAQQADLGAAVLGLDVGAYGTRALRHTGRHETGRALAPGLIDGQDLFLDPDRLTQLCRWLPSTQLEASAATLLRNRALRPRALPETTNERAVLLAATRLLLAQASAALPPLPAQDQVIMLRGGPFSATAGPGAMLLALLDGVEPRGVNRLFVDQWSLWPTLGALAQQLPTAALQVLQQDCLCELGTLCSLSGKGISGEPALRYTIRQDGDLREGILNWGELLRLALGPSPAMLELVPEGGATVEGYPGGSPIEIALAAGTRQLILDGRGRPLTLPTDDRERHEELERWQACCR